MDDYGRRIVVPLPFDTVVGDTCRALREEGFQVIGRVDVRDHFWRDLNRNFRHYALLQAWSPDLAFQALEHDLDTGTALPTVLAIYELDESHAAIVAQVPFAPVMSEPEWRRECRELSAIADRECERVARVLSRVLDRSRHHRERTQTAEMACAPQS
jgi:uncharacterized protein (DUF302 family)